jgi:hypothetical protein
LDLKSYRVVRSKNFVGSRRTYKINLRNNFELLGVIKFRGRRIINPPERVRFPGVMWLPSCMWVSPIQTACEMLSQMPVSRNETVVRVSLPLSQFITGRILWGKDLDYRKNLYDEVLKAINEKIKLKFLCVVDTYYPDQRKLETIVGGAWKEIAG